MKKVVAFHMKKSEIRLKNLGISDITAADSQGYIIGPIITEEYREQVGKRRKGDQYMTILSIYSSSVFQDFESFLRTQFDLIEDDIKLVLDEIIQVFF